MKLIIYIIIATITILIGKYVSRNDKDNERYCGYILAGLTWPISFIIIVGTFLSEIFVILIYLIGDKIKNK